MNSERGGDPHNPVDDEIGQRTTELAAKLTLASQRALHTAQEIINLPNYAQVIPIIKDTVYYTTVKADVLWVSAIRDANGDLLRAWELVEQRRTERRDGLEAVFEERESDSNS